MKKNCNKCGRAFKPTAAAIRFYHWTCLPCRRLFKKAWRDKRKNEGRPVISTRMSAEYHQNYDKKRNRKNG